MTDEVIPGGRRRRRLRDEHELDPTLPLDWRFARVLTMIEHEPRALRCKVGDDDYIRTMRQFLLQYYPRDGEGRKLLYVEFPGPYHALAIHLVNDPEIRLNIQCRLLARQTDEEIAQGWSTSPEAIHWYEKSFFDVRARLDNKDWVVRHVLGDPQQRNLSNIELPLKLVAYFLGPKALDLMLTGFVQVDRASTSKDIEHSLTDFVKRSVCRRAAMAVNAFDANKCNVMQLLQLCRQWQVEEEAFVNPKAGELALLERVKETIQGITFTRGDLDMEHLKETNPELYQFETCAAELRDDQLYEAMAGRTEGLKHLLELKIRDPFQPLDGGEERADK